MTCATVRRERAARAPARLRGWHAGSASYERHLRTALDEWRNVRASADVDDDARVSREEFLRYAEVFLADREAIRSYARGDVQLMFDAWTPVATTGSRSTSTEPI